MRWIRIFVAVAAIHLVLLGLELPPWRTVTKCLLAPILLCWVFSERGPRRLAAALLFCFLGDLFLDLGGNWFIAGMAAFAAAHICLVGLFVRMGALSALRQRPWIVAIYALGAIALILRLLPDLPSHLTILVPIYAVLLTTTAVLAAGINRIAGIGGFLFLVSDALIAFGIAGQFPLDSPVASLSVMALYATAIALLTAGTLAATHVASAPHQ